MIHAHTKLDVWRKSIDLAKSIYAATTDFPTDEKFGLTSQIRRSSVSIPSNIAEGAARESNAEFLRFLFISRGSLAELETQLILANEFGYLGNFNDLEKQVHDVSGLLNGLINHLRGKRR